MSVTTMLNLFICIVMKDMEGNNFMSFRLAGEAIKSEMLKGSNFGNWSYRLWGAEYKYTFGMARFRLDVINKDDRRKLLDTTMPVGSVYFTPNESFEGTRLDIAREFMARGTFPGAGDQIIIPMYYCTASTGRLVYLSKPTSKAKLPHYEV